MSDDRGQAYTLEAIVASLLLLSAIVFALQSTAVTPLSASTSSQHIENQQQATAEGLLTLAADNGSLKRAALNWNVSNGTFYGANETYFVGPAKNSFGTLLERQFGPQGIVYNVYVSYRTPGGGRQRIRMVYRGAPSDNAVRASKIVAVYDGDPLYGPDENPISNRVSASGFYASDVSPTRLFNVFRVEVVAWRQ